MTVDTGSRAALDDEFVAGLENDPGSKLSGESEQFGSPGHRSALFEHHAEYGDAPVVTRLGKSFQGLGQLPARFTFGLHHVEGQLSSSEPPSGVLPVADPYIKNIPQGNRGRTKVQRFLDRTPPRIHLHPSPRNARYVVTSLIATHTATSQPEKAKTMGVGIVGCDGGITQHLLRLVETSNSESNNHIVPGQTGAKHLTSNHISVTMKYEIISGHNSGEHRMALIGKPKHVVNVPLPVAMPDTVPNWVPASVPVPIPELVPA